MGINLVVHAGASAIGLNFPDGIEITIGREIGNTIAPVEAEGLSRRHAKIVQTDGAWRIEDLGSTNGTFVGKEKISGPREIKTGDRVSCGKFTFAVEPVQAESEAAVSSAPPPVEKPVMPKPAAVLTPVEPLPDEPGAQAPKPASPLAPAAPSAPAAARAAKPLLRPGLKLPQNRMIMKSALKLPAAKPGLKAGLKLPPKGAFKLPPKGGANPDAGASAQ